MGLLGLISRIALVRELMREAMSSTSGCQPFSSLRKYGFGSASELAQHGAVERIVGAGRQHVVARIEQRGQAVVDDLAGAEADHDALNILKARGLGLGADGVQGDALAERVAISVEACAHGPFGGVDQVHGRGKVEFSGIADVEVENLVTLVCNLIGNDSEVANGIAYVGHAAGRRNVIAQFGSHR